MRIFNYGKIGERMWDSEILGLVSAIHREAGKQERFLKQRPQELEKLVAIAKVQSTEASNAIEGIITTDLRIRRLVENKTAPKNRDEAEIAGYRDALSIIHENYEAIPLSKNYILQLHRFCMAIEQSMADGSRVFRTTSAYRTHGKRRPVYPFAPFETEDALERICEEYTGW